MPEEKVPDAADALIASLGIDYKAEFVPQSQSRNRETKDDRGRLVPSLNLHVTLTKGRQTLTTDYSQGIGHVPGYPHLWRSLTVYEDRARSYFVEAAESGRHPTASWQKLAEGAACGTAPLDPPTLREVLWSLCMDSDALDAGGFESWASDLGYDTDSRKAKAIYRACIEIALKLRAMLGDSTLTQLREALAED